MGGVLSLKDGLELVKIRAEAMDAATKVGGSQLMVSVVGFARSQVEDVISEVKQLFPGTILQIANEAPFDQAGKRRQNVLRLSPTWLKGENEIVSGLDRMFQFWVQV